MRTRLIIKEHNQYHISSSLLLMFSAPFIVWQMGVLFFSGTTMSLFSSTPIPLARDGASLAIGGGYVFSIVFLSFFPRQAVRLQRIILPLALVATVTTLLPLTEPVVNWGFYVAAFCCVASISAMLSIAAHHFTVETTWRDGIISMVAGGSLIALVQNELFPLDFTDFILFSILLIAAQAIFYYLIPAEIEVAYVSRDNMVKMPKVLFFGLWLLICFATLLICFASSFAESVTHGVSVLFLAAAVMAILLYLLRAKLGVRSLRVFGGFFALAVFGFVLAYLSLNLPGLRILACILLGFVVVLANLWMYFAAISFRIYPTSFIGPIGGGMGLGLSLLHSGLLSELRNNLPLLFGVYAALSVALLLVYYFMEPYFTYAWAHLPDPRTKAEPEIDITAQSQPQSAALSSLSPQELILARLILAGHTETSAAKLMNISLNTQKSYRRNLYGKLDIHTKRELFEIFNEKTS